MNVVCSVLQGASCMYSHLVPEGCACTCHMVQINSPCKVCTLQLAYHGMPTMGDRNCPTTLSSFPIPPLGYNICLMLFSRFRGLEVLCLAVSQLSVLSVSSQCFVSQEQGTPQDHSSLVLYPNSNSIEELAISFLV